MATWISHIPMHWQQWKYLQYEGIWQITVSPWEEQHFPSHIFINWEFSALWKCWWKCHLFITEEICKMRLMCCSRRWTAVGFKSLFHPQGKGLQRKKGPWWIWHQSGTGRFPYVIIYIFCDRETCLDNCFYYKTCCPIHKNYKLMWFYEHFMTPIQQT